MGYVKIPIWESQDEQNDEQRNEQHNQTPAEPPAARRVPSVAEGPAMPMSYGEMGCLPDCFIPGDEILIFDSVTGAAHFAVFRFYGTIGEGDDKDYCIYVLENGQQCMYTEEGIADVTFQANYPCS